MLILFAVVLPPFLCFYVSSVTFLLGILLGILFHLFFVVLGPVVMLQPSCCCAVPTAEGARLITALKKNRIGGKQPCVSSLGLG